MYYTDDPIADFLRHDAEQEAWLKSRPKCSCCKERIQDEEAYKFDDKWVHCDCLIQYRVDVDDYT